MFVTGHKDDVLLRILAQKFHEIGLKNKFNENQMAELVSTFVQTIPYDQEKLDRKTSGLNSDTKKTTYSYEVLFENTGVCQDKSYLAYGILKELGYGVSIFLFPNPEDNHMAVGVKCPIEYSNYESGYCFLETTSLGNKIGMIPDLIPKTRVATSNIKIELIDSNQVEIMSKVDGKEYTGIVSTINTQREIEQLKKSIDSHKSNLEELDEQIKKQEKKIEKMDKKLKKMLKNDDYNDYEDTADDYDDLYSQYKKISKNQWDCKDIE